MTKAIPKLRDLMTKTPTTVSPSSSIASAAEIMAAQHIRHLPVVDGEGHVQGLLSQRDVALLEGLDGLDAASMMVAVAMSKQPYTAAPDAPIDAVAREMADHKYGSCVVVDGGKIVGVFTTVDACRALADAYAGRS